MADKNTQTFNVEDMLSLIKAVSDSNLDSFEYKDGDFSLNLHGSKNVVTQFVDQSQVVGTVVPNALATAQAQFQSLACEEGSSKSNSSNKEEAVEEGVLINSPLVGVFYASPAAGMDPFVKIGDHVKKGQVLAIIEAMKMMNEIESDCDGVISEILVKNECNVEFGQPLFRIS